MDGRSSRPVFTEKRHGSFIRAVSFCERRRSPSFRKFQRARLLLKYEKLGPEKLMEARIIISKSIRRINRSDQFPFISIHRNCAIHFSENRRKKEKRERMDGKRVSEKIGGEKIKIALNVSS